MDHLLSPRDLAAAIGVSESSLKRWIDDGVVKATRTAGGHRRIPLRDALAYIRQTGAVVVQPEALGLADLAGPAAAGRADQFLINAILGGDLAAARGALASRYVAGEPVAPLLDGAVAAAMRQVGDAWRRGPEGVYTEHRATDTCIHSLNFLRSLLPAPRETAPLAIGCSLEGDIYQIPSLMAAIVLAAAGWREINLGANLPVEALAAAVQEQQPAVIWLSFTSAEAVRSGLRDLPVIAKMAARIDAQVIIGGQAINPGAAGERTNVHQLASMEALAGFANGLGAARRK